MIEHKLFREHVRFKHSSAAYVKHTYRQARNNAGMSNKEVPETLRARIVWLAEKRGVGIQALADACDITDKAVYQWRSHDGGLRPQNLVSVAKLLNTTVEWLVLREGPMERPVYQEELTGDRKAVLEIFDSLPAEYGPAMLKVMREFAHQMKLLGAR